MGWTTWRPDPDNTNSTGVVIGEFILSGWIWGANVGWINIGNGFPINNIQYQNNSAIDFGLNYGVDPTQPGYGVVRGYAYAANIGWIAFESIGNPRIRFTDGALEGYAYSANCGWINLGDFTQHNLKTLHILMGTDSNGNGIADAWEYLYFGRLLMPGEENTDPFGTGRTLLQDYLDGVNPTVPNSALRVTAFSTNASGGSSSIMFTSTTGRLYTIEKNTDLLNGTWVLDTNFGLGFIPDAGPTTTRLLLDVDEAQRFYRVKSVRPLP